MAAIAERNLKLFRTMVVLFVIFLCGLDVDTRYSMGSHEHPASAYSWKLPPVGRLFSHEDCGIISISMCQFGPPHRKHTTLGHVSLIA